MNLTNTPDRYGSLSIVLHWMMFLLLVGVYSCIELRELFPKGSDPRNALKAWHFTLGLTVFALVWARLILRLFQVTPAIKPPLPVWQYMFSKSVHFALYILMICMPVAGWLILSGEGKPIPFYGFNLPALIAENKALAENIEEIHKTAGKVGYFLIGLHTVAALYHHYFMRDNTLRRMLPGS
ncbi:MAG TPA: cytochrome b [Halioglobus sp.]